MTRGWFRELTEVSRESLGGIGSLTFTECVEISGSHGPHVMAMLGRVNLEKPIENRRLFEEFLQILNSLLVAGQSRANWTINARYRHDSTLQESVREFEDNVSV